MANIHFSAEIVWAIVAGLMMLPIFMLLGRLSSYLLPPMRRIKWSAALTTLVWGAVVWLSLPGQGAGRPETVAAVAGGLAVLLSAAIGLFLVVSLLAWGFTVAMLLDIHRAGHPLSAVEWRNLYGSGAGFDHFVDDRVRLLGAIGMAEPVGGGAIRLTWRGRFVGISALWFLRFFNVVR